MPQLIATDLDGTILFDRKVPPADLDAMKRWRTTGNPLQEVLFHQILPRQILPFL